MSEIQTLEPVWQDNYTAIAMSSSDEYVPYLSVCLQSIVDHISQDHNYDIIIFSTSENLLNKKVIIDTYSRENVSIRFYNPKSILAGVHLRVTHAYFHEACFYRIVCPAAMPHHKKVIFTDIDLICNTDIRKLYEFDLGDSPLAACEEPIWKRFIQKNANIKGYLVRDYATSVLHLNNPSLYYNTGVIVINLEMFRQHKYMEQLKELIDKNRFLYQEQCALNMLLQGQIKTLPVTWNMEICPELYDMYSTVPITEMNILHFLGGKKPWYYPNIDLGRLWWQYARKSPFYETILQRLFMQSVNSLRVQTKAGLAYPSNWWNYQRVRFLCNVTFGNTRKRYLQKKENLKRQINIGKLLRG